jgi:molybdopterin molybdotransferase
MAPVGWSEARELAHRAGGASPLTPGEERLERSDGRVLARDVVALCDLPPFDASRADGYAVRGPGPWRIVASVPAGAVPEPLADPGTGVRIATGAMVPQGTDAILRVEDASRARDGLVHGEPRQPPEWRTQGETARQGAVLVPAGTPITPGVIGTAASAGHDRLLAYPRPRMAIVVIGSGLTTSAVPGPGRIRDALGPQLPAWAVRLGFEVTAVLGPVPDETAACRDAVEGALSTGAELLVTAGGSGYGPEDPVRGALMSFGAERLIDAIRARPGKPLRLARLAGRDGAPGALALGLPGNPQPAILGLLTLAVPAAAGMTRRPLPPLAAVALGAPIGARGAATRLALCRLDAEGRAHPVEWEAAAGEHGPGVHGLGGGAGFAVVAPGADAAEGERVPFLPLP